MLDEASLYPVTLEGEDGTRAPRRFSVVERLAENAVSLSWYSATNGRLTDQRWTLARAVQKGRCVMSGKEIQRGDLVYRPMRRDVGGYVEEDMALASVIDSISL
ncbi:hypothetical protein P3T16_004803 [Paraburkholderia sp. GAS42]